jgi:glutamate--cysteine ligase
MKTRYREGLSLRYGRTMQTVAGVHYNVSFNRDWLANLPPQGAPQAAGQPQDAITCRYFDLLRNFRRYYWLLVYLFGSTPVVDSSFLIDRPHDLIPLGPETWGLAHATALRMGHLGYQSSAQAGLFVCYNGLASYTRTLTNAIRTPYPPYAALDKTGPGQASGLRQLNSSLLQIENEFYSAIRPKRTAGPGETALTALCKRGVEYLEVRCLDLDPFQPEGITCETMQFIDLFLLFCVLIESPPCDTAEFKQINQNHQMTVTQGRLTDTSLSLLGATHSLRDWGLRLLDAMSGVAELLDTAGDQGYGAVLQQARNRLEHPDTTPSAQVLRACQTRGHQEWGYALAASYTRAFSKADLAPKLEAQLQQLAAQSLQSAAEENTQISGTFEQYLTQYYQQYQDCCPEAASYPHAIERDSSC